MKKITSFCLVFLMLFQIAFAGSVLRDGSAITVRSLDNLNSQEGATTGFVVEKDVMDNNGQVVIEAGAPVVVDIKLEKNKPVGRPGAITITLVSVQSKNGQVIGLRGGQTISPESSKGKVLGISLGLGLTIVWPMIFYLFKKGDAAFMPAGTTINGTINGSYNL